MTITISANSQAATEDGNYIRFTVTLSEPSDDAVTIFYRTLLGTAWDRDLEYQSSSNENNSYYDYNHYPQNLLTFAPGETTKDILIQVGYDSVDEADESVILELYQQSTGAFSNGAPTLQTIGAIQDNDGPGSNLALFVSNPTVVEGASGTKSETFEVRLSQAAASDFDLSYKTIDGTATAGSDYTAATGTLHFVSGQDVAFVNVQIKGDTANEPTEDFFLSVKPGSNAPTMRLDGSVGTGTILADDPATVPVISIGQGSATEEDGHYVRYTLSLSHASGDAVTVEYRTLLGTAGESDLEYRSTSDENVGAVTFAPGQTSADVFIQTGYDNLNERDENIQLELFNANGGVLAAGQLLTRSSGVILDSPEDGIGADQAVFVSDPILLEGASGQKSAVFEVRLSRPAAVDTDLAYKTSDITATAGSDYVAKSGTLHFVQGQTTAYVSVGVNGDAVSEASETFSLVVTSPNNSITTDGAAGTALIMDDDAASPVVTLTGGHPVEEDGNYIHYVVNLSKASLDQVTVHYSTLLGTASASDLEYSPTSSENNGTVTFAAEQTSADVYIQTGYDNLDERDETISLVLSNPNNAVLAGNALSLQKTSFILDNDGSSSDASFLSTPVTVTEGQGKVRAEVEVELSRTSATATTFNVTATNQSAGSSDYRLIDHTVTFAPGQTHASVAVEIEPDAVSEGNETLALSYTLAAGSFPSGTINSTIVTIRPGGIYGTDADNTLTGGSYSDSIFGLGGNDVLKGLAGNDTLDGGAGAHDGADYSDKTQQVEVTLNGAAAVSVKVNGIAEDVIKNIENLSGGSAGDKLGGDANANSLSGGSGDDSLSGRGGNDTLVGGAGSHDVADYSYATTTVTATLNAGAATVTVSVTDKDTLSGIEFLTGGSAGDKLTGDAGANSLSGSGGNDTLGGGTGNDSLNGGAGNDSMTGGTGDDTYFVASTGDKVVEASGGGTDTVLTSVTLTLAVNVENLATTSATGTGAINLAGNALANAITGNAGNNVLVGGDGKDILFGGNGHDTLAGNANDLTIDDGDQDIFRYTSTAQSGTTATTQDIVWGHFSATSSGSSATGDRIDLSAIATGTSASTFSFTAAALSAGHPGQVHVTGSAGTYTVQVNTDADAAPEMTILVHTTTHTFVAGDFIL